MTMRVLLTGATGILGMEILEQLRAAGHDPVPVARRAAGGIEPVCWDMAWDPAPAALTRERWDVIVNSAADTRWSQTTEEAQRANVGTTDAILRLAGPETHVVHISTAAVIGPRSAEGSSAEPADYRNMYEWSKAQAERVVRAAARRLTIVRPPLVIGRRADGFAARFAGMYMVLRGITSSSVPAVVGIPDRPFDIVPVDDVARILVDAALGEASRAVVTPAGGTASPTVGEVIERMCGALNEWRAEQGIDPVAVPPFVNPESWRRFHRVFVDDVLSRRQRFTLDHLDQFVPYMELEEPWKPTRQIRDSIDAVRPCVRHWADRNHRLAALFPRAWAALA